MTLQVIGVDFLITCGECQIGIVVGNKFVVKDSSPISYRLYGFIEIIISIGMKTGDLFLSTNLDFALRYRVQNYTKLY